VRKRIALGLLAATVAVWLVPPPAVAAGRVLRAYEGTTSSGGAITLFTTIRDGVVRFQGVGLEDTATCEDGTSSAFGHGFDLFPRGPRVVEGALDVDHRGFSDAFFVSGTLGSHGGTGTLTHLFAALDASEEPQVCTTGELTWTVERVPVLGAGAPGTVVAGAPGTLVTEVAGGTIETARLSGSGVPAREARAAARLRLRTYEGRTSGRQPLFFVTARGTAGVELFELGIAWELACDDGTSFGLGFFILFAGEPLQAGRVDYDVADPELAFHVNGSLDPHGGAGTTSSVLPALTADLEAQACRSGDLTWRAWRIDAGARAGS
jgi:hypothetical protein